MGKAKFERAAQTKRLGNFYSRAHAFSGGIQSWIEETLPEPSWGGQSATCRRRRWPRGGPGTAGSGTQLPSPSPPPTLAIRAGSSFPGRPGSRSPGCSAGPAPKAGRSRPSGVSGGRHASGGPGCKALASREPAPQHKAAAAQVSAAEPREPVNLQELGQRAPASHGRPPPRTPAAGLSRLRSDSGAEGAKVRRARKRRSGGGGRGQRPPQSQPRTSGPEAPRPQPPQSVPLARDHPISSAPQSSTVLRPQPPIPPSQAPNSTSAPPAPDRPESLGHQFSTPGVPSPGRPRPQPPNPLIRSP